MPSLAAQIVERAAADHEQLLRRFSRDARVLAAECPQSALPALFWCAATLQRAHAPGASRYDVAVAYAAVGWKLEWCSRTLGIAATAFLESEAMK
jgi:hypothetical protein